MIPVLPVINLPPPCGLFTGIEFLPNVFYYLLSLLVLVSIGFILPGTYYYSRGQIIILRNNSKIQRLVFLCYHKLEKLNVLVFPHLFTEKKLKSGTREWKEVLLLNKRWPEYQGSKNPKTELMVLFASLGILIICISALGFFRNFPVIRGSECLERNNNFNKWYCYNYYNSSSKPLDCEEYVRTNESSNSSTVRLQCFAFSLDIGKSSAVAFGLYHICSIVIFGIVFLRKYFYWMCKMCRMPVACGVYCYSVTISLFWLITTVCLLIYLFSEIHDIFVLGKFFELVYRIGLGSIPFVFALFALIIPLRMHRYGVDEWPTYSCLATVDKEVDEETEVERTPSIASDRDECSQYTAFEDETS